MQVAENPDGTDGIGQSRMRARYHFIFYRRGKDIYLFMENHAVYKITNEQAKRFIDNLQRRKMDNLDELKRKFTNYFPAADDRG